MEKRDQLQRQRREAELKETVREGKDKGRARQEADSKARERSLKLDLQNEAKTK